MPHFTVILSGRGIDLPFDDAPVVGFFTTKRVRAPDLSSAEALAKVLVLSDWHSDGKYVHANRGSVPLLSVEQSFPVGWFVGTFTRKPSGYTFYRHED